MRVLVTGAFGVNGIWLVRALRNAGDTVLALDNRVEGTLPDDLDDDIEVRSVDIVDVAALDHAVRTFRPDAIAHLAAVVGIRPADLTYRVNAIGAFNVLDCARENGVQRLVFASSRAVFAKFVAAYGPPEYRPVPAAHAREAWPGGARPYSASKIFIEDVGADYADQYGLEFTALRFASIYGPGKTERHGAVGLHSQIVENAVRGAPVVIAHGGDQPDDMMYVKDVAQALRKALHAPGPIAHAYNIGSGRASTLKEFGREVSAALPDISIRIGDGLDHFGMPDRYGVLDISLATADLGYIPEFDLRSGVRDYIKTLRDRLHI